MSGESAYVYVYVYGFEVALAAVLVVVALVTALARRIGIPNFVPGQMAEAGQRLPRVIDNNGDPRARERRLDGA